MREKFDKAAERYQDFKRGLQWRSKNGNERDDLLVSKLHWLGGLSCPIKLNAYRSVRVVVSTNDPISSYFNRKEGYINHFNLNGFELAEREAEFIGLSQNNVYVTLFDYIDGFSQYFNGRLVCTYYPKDQKNYWKYLRMKKYECKFK